MLFSSFLLCLSTSVRASTTDKNNNDKKENTGEAKAENVAEKEPEQVPAQDSTSIQDGGMYLKHSAGNADINSLCKFNFIFYFIYKHKYEEEQTGNEYLDYEF